MTKPVTSEAILTMINEWTATRELDAPSDPNMTFADAGFDSLASVELAFFLEEKLGIAIDDTVLYNYPTFASLAQYLVEKHSAVASA